VRYASHLVFSLHMHSFWYVALLLWALLPHVAGWLALPLLPVYAVWALQRVYAGRWWATAARALLVALLYLLALVFTVEALGIVSILVD
jgi:hypothetical protein